MKKLLLLAMTFVMMFSFTACSGGSFLSEKDILNVTTNPEVTITLEYDLDDGQGTREVELVFELFYNKAPSTVANFIKLAKDGYYNGKIIDYANIESGAGDLSYISGGRYKLGEDGKIVDDKKNYSIKGEFIANQWKTNDLTHEYGSLVMDRDFGAGEAFDTASTRFYITLNESVQRNRNYCVFGKIKSSKYSIKKANEDKVQYPSANSLSEQFRQDMMDVATETKEVSNADLILSQAPKHNIVFKSVVVDEKGTDYSKAKVAKA